MACKSCGSTDLSEHLGKCLYCIFLALGSSIMLWSLWYWLRGAVRIEWLTWAVGGFAALVTLLLIGHVLARFGRATPPRA
jgi:hypothetical protein